MNLVTLQEYKDFNGIKKPDEDAQNTVLIQWVSDLIKAYLRITDTDGGQMVTETISLDYDTDTVFLKNYPVSSILSVSETDRYTYDSTVHVPLVYSSDFILNGPEGILTRVVRPGGFANWPISPGNLIVSYLTAPKWGLSSSSVPGDLKLATIELINYYKKEGWKSETIQGSTRGGVTALKDQDFPTHIQVILDKYK